MIGSFAVAALLLTGQTLASDADLHRAKTPLPRAEFTASDFKSRSRLFNEVLTGMEGLQTRACEDTSLEDVKAVRDLLLSSANAELNSIYANAGDRRSLSTRSVITPKNKLLSHVMRDALCIETVNLYVHHLTEEEKAEFHSLGSLPLMPLEEHTRDATRARALLAGVSVDDELEPVFDCLDATTVCNLCHAPAPGVPSDVFDETTILTPEAPVFPDAYYTVLAVNRTGIRLSDGSIDPDFRSSRVATQHHYNYTAKSARYHSVFQDGSQSEVLLRVGTVLYTYYPESRYCTAIDVGFLLHAPNWMQLGPAGTEARRLEDYNFDGVMVEVWDREDPITNFAHRLYWNREYNKPVLNFFEGGPYVVVYQYWSDYIPYEPEYHGIYDVPEYCPEPVPQNPNVTTPTIPIIPQNPAVGQGQAGGASNGSEQSLSGGATAGVVVAATVVGVAIAGALYRTRRASQMGGHVRLLHEPDPATSVQPVHAVASV
jgi:hypothetical protein